MNRYMPLDAEFMDDDEALDDRKFKLRRMLKEGDRLRYLYDFGDSLSDGSAGSGSSFALALNRTRFRTISLSNTI